MKEQSQPQPTFDQTAPTPPVPVKQTNKPLIIVVVLVFLLMAGGLVCLGYQNYQLQQRLNQLLEQQSEPITESSKPLSETPPTKMLLSVTLSQFCLNNKINLDKLPFTLSQGIKTAYKVQDSIICFVPDQNYASMSIRLETADFTGDVRNIYFFHQNSKWMGMGDNFQLLSNYKPVTINGQNYWLNVREPGPYGLSSLGIWVDLIGEKKDTATGTTVRVMNLEIIKDQQWLDLVKKYGSQASDAEGNTIYVVSDPSKKSQFVGEIVSLAPQNNALKASAQNISTDLNGVSF